MIMLEEAMVAALPAAHALASPGAGKTLALEALAAETFILYRRPLGPGLYDAIIAACQRAGFSPTIGQEAPRMPDGWMAALGPGFALGLVRKVRAPRRHGAG